MKTIGSYLRVLLFVAIAFILFETTIDSGDQWAIQKYPIIWAVLGVITLFAIAIEVAVEAMKSILFRSLKAEAKERYIKLEQEAKENNWLQKTYKKLAGQSKPIEEESEIILDHNYDGIRELDNQLPPWWVYMFYLTIIFAGVYLTRYEILGADDTHTEYEKEVAQAEKEIAEWKKTAKDLVDENTVTLLTSKEDLDKGKAIFQENCVACHKADGGGGIGPNLTDKYWILGGGIKNVFHTISEGGRDGKGMVSWRKEGLKSSEIQAVASYVLSLQGTTPAEPKAPEGTLWEDENTQPEKTDTTSIESAAEVETK
jgi:cytochrome c oxidase cbb3-type subunit 3